MEILIVSYIALHIIAESMKLSIANVEYFLMKSLLVSSRAFSKVCRNLFSCILEINSPYLFVAFELWPLFCFLFIFSFQSTP
ncbi:unnamed protein product, partial [Vitis vinifera]|uniref:Uncharacterized protein n=1 Tax=Vitis vinifera TaxID=29760 RepID=D7T7Q0_VITVI